MRLTGTLTGPVLVTTECQGITFVANLTTGAHNVTFGNGVGSPVMLPQGAVTAVTTDAANGALRQSEFKSGTRLVSQGTVPPGWTKDTATSGLNNSVPRFVTGSLSQGGSADFTAVFTSKTPSGTVGGHAITIDQMPFHSHPWFASAKGDIDAGAGGGIKQLNRDPQQIVGPWEGGNPNANSGNRSAVAAVTRRTITALPAMRWTSPSKSLTSASG